MTFLWQRPTVTCPCRAHVSRRPWQYEHMGRMGKIRNACRIVILKHPHGTRTWKDIIKMCPSKAGCEDVRWLHLAQNCAQWWALVLAWWALEFCYNSVVLRSQGKSPMEEVAGGNCSRKRTKHKLLSFLSYVGLLSATCSYVVTVLHGVEAISISDSSFLLH